MDHIRQCAKKKKDVLTIRRQLRTDAKDGDSMCPMAIGNNRAL